MKLTQRMGSGMTTIEEQMPSFHAESHERESGRGTGITIFLPSYSGFRIELSAYEVDRMHKALHEDPDA